MSLTIDFPGFHVHFEQSQASNAAHPAPNAAADWQNDLQDLSGDEADDAAEQQQQDQPPQEVFPGNQASPGHAELSEHPCHVSTSKVQRLAYQDVPDVVLVLVAERLSVREVMSMALCCKAWHACILGDDVIGIGGASSAIWQQQEKALLGAGWPWPPFRGSTPLQLPPSLGSTPRLHLKATLATSKVALQYAVMRKGFEFMLQGFEELWAAVVARAAMQADAADDTAAAAACAGAEAAAGAAATSQDKASLQETAGEGRPHNATAHTSSQQQQQQLQQQQQQQHPQQHPQQQQQQPLQQQQPQPACSGGRQLQRLVDKLALHNWQLTYSGFSVAIAARCDELAQALRQGWCQQQQQGQGQQQQQQHLIAGTAAVPYGDSAGAAAAAAAAAEGPQSPLAPAAAAALCISPNAAPSNSACPSPTAAATTAAAASPNDLLPAAMLAACAAGGLCSDIQSVSGGLGVEELLAGEPELLLAATRKGPRPDAAIVLWSHLLTTWEHYRRWLDLLTGRCGLLGARVAAARQLMEQPPLTRGPPNAALLPHLRNKGLLLFRGHVLLGCGLRRPLQEAALWLAAAAAADASAWRCGGGCSECDLELLIRVRKLLTELDVADGQDEESSQHTHAKFRRCFGALLTRARRSRCLPASAW